MDAPFSSTSSTTGCTIQNLRLKPLTYLSGHTVHSHTFKYLLANQRKTAYRFANAVFEMIGLIVSDDVILHLIKSSCISNLLHRVDACVLTKSVYIQGITWVD